MSATWKSSGALPLLYTDPEAPGGVAAAAGSAFINADYDLHYNPQQYLEQLLSDRAWHGQKWRQAEVKLLYGDIVTKI